MPTKDQQGIRQRLYQDAVKYGMFQKGTMSFDKFNYALDNVSNYADKVANNYRAHGVDLGDGNSFRKLIGAPTSQSISARAKAQRQARMDKTNPGWDYGGRSLAEGMRRTADRINGKTLPDTTPQIPYRQTRMPNMMGPSKEEQQAYQRAGKQAGQGLQQNERRRNTPIRTDTPASITKTQGQYEDEQHEQWSKDSLLNGIAQQIASEKMGDLEKMGADAYHNTLNNNGDLANSLGALREYNKITSPEELWKRLNNDDVRSQVASALYKNYQLPDQDYRDEIKKAAKERGISPEQYVEQYALPEVSNAIANAFEGALSDKYKPQDFGEYLARKFTDSGLGTLVDMSTMSRGQRQRRDEATAKYEETLTPWQKRAGQAMSILGQTPEIFGTGVGGGLAVKGVAKVVGKKLIGSFAPRVGALIANGGNSLLGSATDTLAQKFGQWAIRTGYAANVAGAGMGGFEAFDTMRREISTGQNPELASIALSTIKSFGHGYWEGMKFGLANIPGQQLISRAGKIANTAKRTIAKTGAQVASFGIETGVFTASSYAQWKAQPHSKDDTFDWTENGLDSATQLLTLKLQGKMQQAPAYISNMRKRVAAINKADPSAHATPFKLMSSDFISMFSGKTPKSMPFRITDDDKEIVEKATGKTIQELGATPENLLEVFGNKQIPWVLRNKISAGTTGALENSRPRTRSISYTYWTPEKGGKNTITEMDEQGNPIEVHEYTTTDERDAILGKAMMRRDNSDLLSFLTMYRMGLYKGAVYNHAQNEAIFKDTVTEMGYDYDRMRVDKKYNQQVTDELNGTKNREYQDLYKKKIMEAPTRDEEVVSQFAKDNGMKPEEVMTIIQKDPLDRTDDEQSLMDDLRQTLHDDLFQQGELHINQSTQDGADSADRIRIDDFNTFSDRWGYYSKLVADNTKNWNDAFNSIKGLKEVVDSAGKDATPDKDVDAIQSSETLSDADKAKAIATFSDLNNAKALQNGFFSQAYNRINTEVGREFIEHIPTQGSKIFDSEGNPLKFQVLSVTTGETNMDGTPKVYTIKSSTGLNFREDGTVDPNGDPHASVVLQDPFGNTKVVSAHDQSLKLIGTESTDEFTARRTQQIQVGLSQAFASKEVKREPAAGSEETPEGTSTETPTNGLSPTEGSVGSGSATASQDIPLTTRVSEYDNKNGTELGRFISYLDNGKQLPEGESRHFKVGHTGDLLNSLGIKGDIAVSTTTVGNRHTKNEAHNLSSQDWFDVINDLNTPLAITKYGDGYRIYTHVHIDGDKAICAGVEVRKVGHGLDITNIKTAFGRDLSKILWNEDVLYPTDINKLKQAIAEFSSSDNSRIYPPQPEGKDSDFSVIEDTDGVKKMKMPSGKLVRVNSEGYPYYTEADPSDAAAELIHRYADDPDRVDRKVDVKIKNAQKVLDKAEKAKPSEAEDDAQFDREEDARKKAIDDAKSNLDHWNNIKNEVAKQRTAKVEAEKAEQDRQTAFNALQNIYKQATDMGLSVDGVESLLNDKNATTDQLNTMRHAVEDAIKKEQERINAQRGLEGVPTIDKDTPKDARSRGFRNDNGTRIDRQTETKGVVGRESVARFSYKPEDEKKGHLKLIDASELQPSHLAGVRNPHFFIDEAQPKDRTDAESITKEQTHAKGIRPELITKDGNAYAETAPVVNTRGEVIQGNHRSAVLKTMYDGGYTESIEKYKQYLKDHAEEFGIKPEDVDKMKNPVLVNEIDVNDKEAIRLGQMTSRDLESGGIRDINPSVTATKLLTTDGKFNMENFVSLLLRTQDPDASISQLIVTNGADVIKLMAKNNIISDTEAVSSIDKETGRLTPEAKAALKDILLSMLFKNGKSDLPKIFDSLPIRVQNAIATTFARDFQSPESERIIGYLQQAIDLLYNARQDVNFAKTTTLEDAKGAMSTWLKGQDAFSQRYNAEGYGNVPVELATRMQVMKQTEISAMLDRIFDKVQARTKTGQGEMKFDEKGNPIKEEPKPMPLSQALKEELGIDNITKQVHFKDPQIKKETTKQIAEGLQKKGIVVHMSAQEGQERLDKALSDGEDGIKFSKRTKPAPKKTQKVYKLMRLGKDGKLYPLFIDSSEGIDLGQWYDADSPDLSIMKKLDSGVWLIDPKSGKATSLHDYNQQNGVKKDGKHPSKQAIEEAANNGQRWVSIVDKKSAQKRYGGETRSYYNLGVNGSGSVSEFAMRPGWHAGSLPTMRQIGKGKNKDLRDDSFVWVEGEVPADKDYNAEAQANPDHDIPDHIPTDGFYLKSTNANASAAQSDRMGWYVAGAFKADRIISDKQARDVIDKWNDSHPDKKVEYDWKRQSGKDFDGDVQKYVNELYSNEPQKAIDNANRENELKEKYKGQSSKDLFVSLKDKTNTDYNDTVSEITNRVLSGRASLRGQDTLGGTETLNSVQAAGEIISADERRKRNSVQKDEDATSSLRLSQDGRKITAHGLIKKENDYDDTVTELARRATAGEATVDRLGEEIEVKGGRYETIPALAGRIIASGNPLLAGASPKETGLHGADGQGRSGKRTGTKEEVLSISGRTLDQLINWAKANGCYFDESEVAKNSLDGKMWKDGCESYVYRSKDGKSVIKVTNFQPWAWCNDIMHRLDQIKAHNALFPDTHIDVLGYGINKDGNISVFTRQPLVEGKTIWESTNGKVPFDDATQEQIDRAHDAVMKALDEMGFTKEVPWIGDPELTAFSNGKFTLFDANNSDNIIIDKDGKYHVIDCEVLPVGYDKIDKFDIKDSSSVAYDAAPQRRPSTDGRKFFKTSHGEVYGFVDLKTGEIYLDPQHMDPNLTIHEYGHLWAAAVKVKDPKRWQSIVDRVNEAAEGKLKTLFDDVRKADPDLKGDDLAEEVLMRYSGTKGMKLLDEEAKKIWDSGKTVDEKQVAKGAIEKVVDNLKNTIREFWKDVADILGIKYRNVDDIADHIIHDALSAKNPKDLKAVDGEGEADVNQPVINHITKVLDRVGEKEKVSENGVVSRSISLPVNFKGEEQQFRKDYQTITGKEAPRVLNGITFSFEGKDGKQYSVTYQNAHYKGHKDTITYRIFRVDEEAGKKVKIQNLQSQLADLKKEAERLRGMALKENQQKIADITKQLKDLGVKVEEPYKWHTIVGPYATTIEATPNLVKSAEESWAKAKELLDKSPNMSQPQLQREMRLGFKVASLIYDRWKNEKKPGKKKSLSDVLKEKGNLSPEEKAKVEKEYYEQRSADLYEIEREKSGYTGDYAQVLKDNDTWRGAVKALRDKAADYRKQADDWRNRQYKDSKGTVTTEDVNGDQHTTSFNAINEKRRQNNIKNLEQSAKECEDMANELVKRVQAEKLVEPEKPKAISDLTEEEEATFTPEQKEKYKKAYEHIERRAGVLKERDIKTKISEYEYYLNHATDKAKALTYKHGIAIYKAELKKREEYGEKYGIKNGKVTLDHLSEIFHKFNSDDSLTPVFERVLAVCKQFNPEIKFTKALGYGTGGNAGSDGIIKYNIEYLLRSNVKDQDKASTLLHEMVHNATLYALEAYDRRDSTRRGRNGLSGKDTWNKLTKGQQKAVEEIYNIYEQIKGDYKDFPGKFSKNGNFVGDKEKAQQYGLTNVYEMVAEIYSNGEFREQAKKKNLWGRLKDAIVNFFTSNVVGSTKTDVMQALKERIDYLLEHPNKEAYEAARGYWRPRKSDKVPVEDHKEKQLDIIKRTNPMEDDYHVGIRSTEDINTFKEAVDNARNDDDLAGALSSYPDVTNDMIERALKDGKITVYSSKPIKEGSFITPSKMQAEDYAGGRGKQVFSKEIPVDDAAWVNTDEGQYAPVQESNVAYDGENSINSPRKGTDMHDVLLSLQHDEENQGRHKSDAGPSGEDAGRSMLGSGYRQTHGGSASRVGESSEETAERLGRDGFRYYPQRQDYLIKFSKQLETKDLATLYARYVFQFKEARKRGEPTQMINSAMMLTAIKDELQTRGETPFGTNLALKKGKLNTDTLKDTFKKTIKDKRLNEIFDKVSLVTKKLGISFIGEDKLYERNGQLAFGRQDLDTGNIILNNTAFNSEFIPDGVKMEVLLHEMLHVATRYVLRAEGDHGAFKKGGISLTPEMKEAARKINDVYESIKNDPDFSRSYGIHNAEEMIAEAGSSLSFRQKLKEKGLWTVIKDGIKRLFGFGEGNADTTAMKELDKVLDYLLDNFDEGTYRSVSDTYRDVYKTLRDMGYTDIPSYDSGSSVMYDEAEPRRQELEAPLYSKSVEEQSEDINSKVADGGFHKVLGHEGFNNLMRDIYLHVRPQSMRDYVRENMWQNNLNVYKTLGQYLAEQATKPSNLYFWSEVNARLNHAIDAAGYSIELGMRQTKYLSWLAQHPQDIANPLKEAERISVYNKIMSEPYSQPVQHGEFQDFKGEAPNTVKAEAPVTESETVNPAEPQDSIAPPVHSLTGTDVKSVVHNDQAQQQFADPAKPTLPPTSTPVQHFAKAMYNKGLAHWFYVWKEAHIDRTQAAQLLVRSILGVKKKLGLIQGSIKGLLKEDEDFLSGMNQLGSKAKAQGKVFEQTIAKPLNKVIQSILPEFGKSTAMGNMTELQNYMYDKSGLERNRVFFVRDIHHKWLKNADKADRAVEKAEEFKKKADKMLVSAIKSKDNDQINAATLVVKKADTELKRAQRRAAKVRKEANVVYKDFLDFKNNDLTPKLKSGKITLKEYYHQLDEYIRGLKGYDKYVAGEHDYSGLSSHYGDKKTYDDDKVIDAVMNIEKNIGADRINSLWDATNLATRYGIGVERKAGLIGKDLYDHLNSMFSWYVPMRGFEENMAEDIYTYLNAPYNSSSKPKSALQKALGRKSHGDVDIFAEIGAMTARSIYNAEQNSMVNQRFATFIRNHYNVDGEDRLVSEIKPWAVKKIDPQGNEVWEEAFPQLDEIIGKDKQGNPIYGESITNADEITKRIKDFNAQMEQLQAQGTAKVLDEDDTIPYEFISKAHRSAHIVTAYFDGKEHLFIVNGNPRAAQAINGELEPHNWFGSGIVHGMSQLMTTYSVDFLGSNLSRDATYAGANIYINEGVDYYRRYFNNYHKIWLSFAGTFSRGIKNKASAGSLIYRYNHGTLNLNNTDDRLFKEYMDNGGETGWTSMENVDKWKKKIRKAFQSKTKENTMAVIKAIPNAVEFANQHAENLARFAVYMTSRKMGRSITRSIADAKEVSVNFQRKGAGWKTKDFKYEGEGKAGQVNTFLAATSSQLARSYLAFYNAGIQGLNTWVKNNVEHPGRTTLVTSIALAGGIFVPFLNKILQNFFDSDEDKKGIPDDPYAELPETTRRQNLCIYVGGGDFLTIPLGIEVRASYGIGDIMAGLTTNPELKSDNVPNDIASQITQILPVDFLGEGYTNPLMTLTPTAIRPVLEGGLPSVIVGEGNASEGENQKWNGLPLRRDRTDYNKHQPAWMRAFASTGGAYMWFAKTLDKATNDLNSPNVKGSLDVDPAQLENYAKGFFGGVGQITSELGNMKRDIDKAKKEGNLSAGTVLGSSNMPILRRFHYKPTEQNRYYRTRTRWFHYRDEAQQFDTDMKGLEKDGHANPIEYAKTKAPRYRAMEARRNVFKQAMKEYNNYSKLMAIDPNTADAYSLQRDMLMENTVQQLDKIK